jgi:hypothetical protein
MKVDNEPALLEPAPYSRSDFGVSSEAPES